MIKFVFLGSSITCLSSVPIIISGFICLFLVDSGSEFLMVSKIWFKCLISAGITRLPLITSAPFRFVVKSEFFSFPNLALIFSIVSLMSFSLIQHSKMLSLCSSLPSLSVRIFLAMQSCSSLEILLSAARESGKLKVIFFR